MSLVCGWGLLLRVRMYEWCIFCSGKGRGYGCWHRKRPVVAVDVGDAVILKIRVGEIAGNTGLGDAYQISVALPVQRPLLLACIL